MAKKKSKKSKKSKQQTSALDHLTSLAEDSRRKARVRRTFESVQEICDDMPDFGHSPLSEVLDCSCGESECDVLAGLAAASWLGSDPEPEYFGSGGSFVPPLYLTEHFVPIRRIRPLYPLVASIL